MKDEKTDGSSVSKRPSLLEEIAQTWSALPNHGLFLILFASWLLFFEFLGNSTLGYVDTRSLFGWVFWIYDNSPDDEHGLLIPFAVLVLLWWKRDELLRLKKESWWPALGIVALALLLHVIGYVVQQTRISVVAFFLGLYGLTGLVWGRGWLIHTFFPMILFGFCVPIASLAEVITFPMRMLVTAVSVGFSHNVLGIDVFREGSQIMDIRGRAMYDVAPACSGIRSLTTLTALTMIYGFITFRSVWKRCFMIAIALPLAFLGNLMRVTTVIIVGEAFGTDVAKTIEQKFGFVTFAFALGGALLIGWLLDRQPAPATPPATRTAEGAA